MESAANSYILAGVSLIHQREHLVDHHSAGERLDRFLARVSGVSLRAARRCIERGGVLVDGRLRGPGWKVTLGSRVTAHLTDDVPHKEQGTAREARLLVAAQHYAAFFKPSGLHTVTQAGSGELALEALLGDLLPAHAVFLVNRLDRDTSGIVLGAFGRQAVLRFRGYEKNGQVDKRYLALVQGEVKAPVRCDWALDTRGGSRVRVRRTPAPDELRTTWVRPLAIHNGTTLVEARIRMGARHQIRAHLAYAGHAIIGDVLYGGCSRSGGQQGGACAGRTGRGVGAVPSGDFVETAHDDAACGPGLRLHHWRVSFPEFQVEILPDWEEVKVLHAVFAEGNPCGI